MKVALGADHGGYGVKEIVAAELKARGIETLDVGCHGTESVDYPDFAHDVSRRVSSGEADEGILVCTAGIGMSIAANRYAAVRAALCLTPDMATVAREHNNANVLVMGGRLMTPETVAATLDAWFRASFSGAERHMRRLSKLQPAGGGLNQCEAVRAADPELFAAMEREANRQQRTLCLIASENYVSAAVRESQGTVLTNKYAEGYPGKRWYNGCEDVDVVEQLAIDRAKELFGAEHVNVQPHSGSSANTAVYLALLQPGDTLMAMDLAHGGHLTHGHPLNISGRLYRIAPYGVQPGSEILDYDALAALARAQRPKLIVAGASAYTRTLDFKRFREIADDVGALLMVDMAHIAGLIAGGAHPSPFPLADIVTTTTHKTLRGPRSGMILCREAYAAAVDRVVFPGLQGGPLMHTIASKAVCFREALAPAFKDYAAQIVRNAAVLADALRDSGCRLVSGGTDNHIVLLDVTPLGLSGKQAAAALERAGLVANKNTIPFDGKSAFVTSGVRVGTPAVTTRGFKEAEMKTLAGLIETVLRNPEDAATIARAHETVADLAARFPAP